MHLSLSAGGDSAEKIGNMLEEQASSQLTSQGHTTPGTERLRSAIREYAESAIGTLVNGESASVSVSLSIQVWKAGGVYAAPTSNA